MTEQEDKSITATSPPEIMATTTPPAAPAAKPVPKVKAGSNSRKKTTAANKPVAVNTAPDLNDKDYPLHPARIWPD